MPRTIWKGSITFGLVYIPVALYPATQEQGLDFDWLDKRDMSPVGYKRVNKVTGKEVAKEQIVKGLAYSEGRYALLTEEEIRAANPAATQTVELLAFVDEGAIFHLNTLNGPFSWRQPPRETKCMPCCAKRSGKKRRLVSRMS